MLPEEYGEVFAIKQRLVDCGALSAAMSGSGPTVFGLFDREEIARRAVETLKKDYPETFLARPVKKF